MLSELDNNKYIVQLVLADVCGFNCSAVASCLILPITEWKTGVPVGQPAPLSLCVVYDGAPLYSTDLNSSGEPTDIGRNPSFSFYLSPAAVLRINAVYAALFHRLMQKNRNKQSQHEAMCALYTMRSACGRTPWVVPWDERGWCSTSAWSWSSSVGPQWSPQWYKPSSPCALEDSAPSSEALGSFWLTDVWK